MGFAGPLPHPQILQGYEQVCPGAASRIIEMVEQQGANRRLIEQSMATASQDAMRRQFQEARVGQFCALLVALAFIVAGTYVAIHGNAWPGALLGGGGVGLQALVATFVRGRTENQGDDDGDRAKAKSAPQGKQHKNRKPKK